MRQIMCQLKQILFPWPSMVVIGENASIAQKALNCLIHPEMEEKNFYHYRPWYYPSHGKKHYFASVITVVPRYFLQMIWRNGLVWPAQDMV